MDGVLGELALVLLVLVFGGCGDFVVDASVVFFADITDSEFLTESDEKWVCCCKVRSNVNTYNDIF